MALTRIGKPATPAIIAELGRVFEKITLEYDSKPQEGREDLVKGEIEGQTDRAEIQMCAALQVIGDENTAEMLEQLLKSDRYMGKSASEIINATITTIRAKTTPRWGNVK